MVLRAGIILPFQFGDIKKLLMVGSPEEDRELKLYDFTNVVRAAFNIYHFEFRNKKIDFLIPEELLIHYLEQCKDLTNFVIQVDQASIHTAAATLTTNDIANNDLETLCAQHKSTVHIHKPIGTESNLTMRNNFTISSTALPRSNGDLSSPLDVTTHSSDHSMSNNIESIKFRRSQFFVRTPEPLTQSIDPIDIMPKSEQEDSEIHGNKMQQQKPQSSIQTQIQLTQQEQSQQQQQQQQIQLSHQTSHFFPNYGHTVVDTPPAIGSLHTQSQSNHPHHMQHATNRFRRRGERMSKDQKQLYVKFFEENPCMLQQRRNDVALTPLWNKLASMLNNVQQGAVKNVEEWKQTFDAWRYRVFMYSRYNSKLTGDAAQNPKNYKPLTHTDQRAYAMWTSHRNSTSSEYDKMDMFVELEETQPDDYDY